MAKIITISRRQYLGNCLSDLQETLLYLQFWTHMHIFLPRPLNQRKHVFYYVEECMKILLLSIDALVSAPIGAIDFRWLKDKKATHQHADKVTLNLIKNYYTTFILYVFKM